VRSVSRGVLSACGVTARPPIDDGPPHLLSFIRINDGPRAMIQEFATGFAFVYALEQVGDKYGIESQ
jgi:hypothetical protein